MKRILAFNMHVEGSDMRITLSLSTVACMEYAVSFSHVPLACSSFAISQDMTSALTIVIPDRILSTLLQL